MPWLDVLLHTLQTFTTMHSPHRGVQLLLKLLQQLITHQAPSEADTGCVSSAKETPLLQVCGFYSYSPASGELH